MAQWVGLPMSSPMRVCGPSLRVEPKTMAYRTFRSSVDSPARCRSRTRASISSGASAYFNTSTIRMRPSMTSPGCCGRAAVRSCWTPTRGRGSSPISILTSPRRCPRLTGAAGADDAVESGGPARDVAEAAVGVVHAAAERGEAFAAITVFGFVARKLGTRHGMPTGRGSQLPSTHGPR